MEIIPVIKDEMTAASPVYVNRVHQFFCCLHQLLRENVWLLKLHDVH